MPDEAWYWISTALIILFIIASIKLGVILSRHLAGRGTRRDQIKRTKLVESSIRDATAVVSKAVDYYYKCFADGADEKAKSLAALAVLAALNEQQRSVISAVETIRSNEDIVQAAVGDLTEAVQEQTIVLARLDFQGEFILPAPARGPGAHRRES